MKRNLPLLLCLLLLLCGCGRRAEKPIELTLSPWSPPEQSGAQSVTFYTFDPAKELMVSTSRNLPILPEQNKAQAALELLFSEDRDFDFVKNSSGVYDYRILQSNRSAILQINNPCPVQDDFHRFTLHMSIVNTLAHLENINTVVIYAGEVELADIGFIGPLQFFEGNIRSYFQELRLHNIGTQLSANLFYMDSGGGYILPETTTFSAQRSNLLGCLQDMVRRMANGPTNKPDLANTISPAVEVLSARRSGGELILNLSAPPTLDGNQKPALAYGALFLSIQGVYPDITGIRFLLNGSPVTAVTDLNFEGGLAQYQHFSHLVGSYDVLYFARRERNSLLPVNRAIEASQYNNPAIILTELLSGPGSSGEAYSIFPRSMSRYDLNSCTLQGDTAVVDFKATFFDNCKSLDLAGESLMIYGIVNSLTQMENVNRVQFLMEGQRFVTLTGNLYYMEPFIENPGLVLRHL